MKEETPPLTAPNVMIILTDQLRAQALGCYGNEQVMTPHIDALAAESLRFEQAISNCPVCMPARSALLSGQYARRCTGNLNNHHLVDEAGNWYITDPPEHTRTQLPLKCLPEHLKGMGYANALIGKWHIHPEPRLLGFDSWCYPLVYHRYYHQGYFENDTAYVVDEFAPFFEVNKFAGFLDRHATDKPFFCYYNISLPHMPLSQMPDAYRGLYNPDQLALRPNVRSQSPEQDAHWFRAYMSMYIRGRKLDVPEVEIEQMDIRTLTSLYYSLVTITDDIVGRLVAQLKQRGLYENTLILFTSDHGDMLGSHGLYNKEQLYEESIRVPLLLHGPGINPGVCTGQIAQIIDLMPTLLEYLGADIPDGGDGQSLMPVVRGQRKELERNAAFIECNNYKMGIRTPRYTYGIQIDPRSLEVANDALLFHDLAADPYQQTNLLDHLPDDLKPTAQALRDQCVRWHRETPWLDNPCRFFELF